MTAVLRSATEDDAAGVLAIYAPIVRESPTTFELQVPDADEMRGRIRDTLAQRPWLVCAPAGGAATLAGAPTADRPADRPTERPSILGYAYAGPHRARAAYQWCVEVSVYVHATARRGGVARALYAALLELLRRQGFVNAYAGITLPNTASVGLHESLGFRPIGVYPQIGFKGGRWHDVGWWQLALASHPAPPAAPRPYPLLRDTREHADALAAGAALLRR